MYTNGVKLTKPNRESWETAAGYAARLEYVGKAIKERLTLEANAYPTLDERGKARIEAVVRGVRTGANPRWLFENAQRFVRPDLVPSAVDGGDD